jgi:hypothetical protein
VIEGEEDQGQAPQVLSCCLPAVIGNAAVPLAVHGHSAVAATGCNSIAPDSASSCRFPTHVDTHLLPTYRFVATMRSTSGATCATAPTRSRQPRSRSPCGSRRASPRGIRTLKAGSTSKVSTVGTRDEVQSRHCSSAVLSPLRALC